MTETEQVGVEAGLAARKPGFKQVALGVAALLALALFPRARWLHHYPGQRRSSSTRPNSSLGKPTLLECPARQPPFV
jgi:hypothetical protein